MPDRLTTTTGEYTDDQLRYAQTVLDATNNVLVGQGRLTQVIVLAAQSAQWINGHNPEFREEALLQLIRGVRYFMENSKYRDFQ